MEFKSLWADIAVGAMPTVAIIIHFDVFENDLPHCSAADSFFPMHNFHLQAVKKALGTGIVVAIALGAHAAYQIVLAQETLVSTEAVLTAPVGMHDPSAAAIEP